MADYNQPVSRTPKQAQAIISQMESRTEHTLSADQRAEMLTDLQNGAKVNMPDLVNSNLADAGAHIVSADDLMRGSPSSKPQKDTDGHTYKEVSMQDLLGPYDSTQGNGIKDAPDKPPSGAFKPDSVFSMSNAKDSLSVLGDTLSGVAAANAHAFGRIYEATKKALSPPEFAKGNAVGGGTILSREEVQAAKDLGLDDRIEINGNGKGYLGPMYAKSAAELKASSANFEAKHPGLYNEKTQDKESPANFAHLILEESLPANLVKAHALAPLHRRQTLDDIHAYIDQKYILNHSDQFPAVSVQAAHEAMSASLHKASGKKNWDKKSIADKLVGMKNSIIHNPTQVGMNLFKGIISDPELLALPFGSASKAMAASRDILEAGESASKLAKVSKIVGGLVKPTIEGAGINTAIESAKELADTGGIDPQELKQAAAVGAIFGGSVAATMGATSILGDLARKLYKGAADKINYSKLSASDVHDAAEEALKGAAEYDATVEAVVSKAEGVPEKLSDTLNKSLGILSDEDAKSYLSSRRKDVRAAFKDDQEGMADYLDWFSKTKENTRMALAEQKRAQDKVVRDTRDQSYEDYIKEEASSKRDRFQQEYDQALRAKKAIEDGAVQDEAISHNELLKVADNKLAEAQANINAKDAAEAVYEGKNVAEVRRMLNRTSARDAGRELPKNKRGFISPEMATHLGLGALGIGLGAGVSPDDHKIAGAVLGGLAGFSIPFAFHGDIGGQASDIGGRQRGSIGRLSEAQKGFEDLMVSGQSREESNAITEKSTGWYKDSNGHWQLKIPDAESKLDADTLDDIKSTGQSTTLGKVITHADLYKAYPNIKEIPVSMERLPEGVTSKFSVKDGLTINNDLTGDAATKALSEGVATVVQKLENFAYGGNQDAFLALDPVYGNAITMKERLHAKLAMTEGVIEQATVEGQIAKVDAILDGAIHNSWKSYWSMLGGSEAAGKDIPSHLRDLGMADDEGNLSGYQYGGDKLPNERAVIDKAAAGDQEAMRSLFNKYYPRLKRFLSRYVDDNYGVSSYTDPSDIAQETMIKVFNKLKGFRHDSSFYTWVHRTAINTAKDAYRMRGSRVSTTDDSVLADSSTITSETPEEVARTNQAQRVLDNTLKHMPKRARDIFIKHHIEGINQKDIAKELGVAQSLVNKYLQKASADIQDALIGEYSAVKGPRNARGFIDKDLLSLTAVLSLGAGAGAYLARQHSMLLGGITGGLLALGLGSLAGKGLSESMSRATVGIIDRMHDMSPAIWKRQIAFEYHVLTETDKALRHVDPFLERAHKIKNPIRDELHRLLLSGTPKAVDTFLQAIGDKDLIQGWSQVRQVLDTLEEKQIKLGRYKKGIDDYFPRIVVDFPGLLKAMGKKDRGLIEEVLRDAENQSLGRNHRPLTDYEKSQIVNKQLTKIEKGSKQPGFAKERKYQEVPPELVKFYAKPAEALHSYLREAVLDIKKSEFFGKHLQNVEINGKKYINTDESIGSLLTKDLASGEISSEQFSALSNMLKARFGPGERGSSRALQAMKNLGNAGILANFWSATTQYGDAITSLYTQGIIPTLTSVVHQLTGRKEISVRDYGLTNYISEEFVSTDKSAKFVKKLFELSLFTFVDNTGKNTVLGASTIKLRRLARTAKGVEKLRKLYGDAWGDTFPQLVKEIKSGKLTDDVKIIAMAELGRSQPISKSHLPETYLNHPEGRVFYWLHTFQLRMFSLARADVFKEISKGNIGKGMANLAKLSIVLGLGGATTDNLKNFLLGKPLNFSWAGVVANAFKVYGLSNYLLDKAAGMTKEEAKKLRKAGFKYAHKTSATPSVLLTDTLTPPFRMFDTLITGNPQALRYVPLFGPLLYNEFQKNSKPAAKRNQALSK